MQPSKGIGFRRGDPRSLIPHHFSVILRMRRVRTPRLNQQLNVPLREPHILVSRRIATTAWENLMPLTSRGSLAAAIALGAMILAAPVFSVPALAEDGVSASEIVFGQAAVLEGPASALGVGMRTGLQAAFDEVNAKGGVHGR